MADLRLNARRAAERGESNAKLIVTVVILATIGYLIYSMMPIYYKEQQLIHDIREAARVGAINGRSPAQVQPQVDKIIEDIAFPEKIESKIEVKGKILTITCTGTMPINFFFYVYPYEVNVVESANRGDF
jgi:predicted PurR-regulated permease PerM